MGVRSASLVGELAEVTIPQGGLHSTLEGSHLLTMASRVLPGQAIVEIGSYIGASTMWLAQGANGDVNVVTIDLWPEPSQKEQDLAHAQRQREAYGKFVDNMSQRRWPAVALRMRSVQAAGIWVQPVGMWFHDADHRYDSVMDDWYAWRKHLAPGCWVALHDYYGDEMEPTEVAKAVGDIHKTEDFTDVMTVDKLWTARLAM